MNRKILILGNDEKMQSCKSRLNELGFTTDCINFDIESKISEYSEIILPLPALADRYINGTDITLDKFISLLKKEQTVFCSNISAEIFPCRAISYYNNSFIQKNSRLTAQGTLKIILDIIKTDISTMCAAVIGYGNCGREICRILKNCGADVTAFVMRENSAVEAEENGIRSDKCSNIDGKLSEFDIMVNTVPVNIIGEQALESLTEKNLYIEIASAPYGFDVKKAGDYRFEFVLASSLPAKFTPIGAGINIADTVVALKEVNYE